MSVDAQLARLIGAYGAWIVAGTVALESMGVPLPGETTLVTAAVYAGTTGRLSIGTVVTAAAIGAIAGDNAGFWIGRALGYRWVVAHQRALRLNTQRLKLGQYLFLRHGGKVVFFGRFVAVLRAFAAVLAGINCMDWRRFLLFNSAGGISWAAAYGVGAYAFGQALTNWLSRLGIVLGSAVVGLVVIGLLLARKYEQRLEDQAEHALPGPLRGPGVCR